MDLSVHPYQILCMFFIFMASVFTLNTLVFKPTLQVLKEREKHLTGLEKQAKTYEQEYQQKFEAYGRLIEEAKSVARHTRDDILKTAEAEQKNIIAQARGVAEKQILEAKKTISIQTNEARLKLRQSVQDIAKSMVEKILKRKAA